MSVVDGDQRAGAKKIPRRRNVVAGLIPVIGQPQQREVAGIERHEDDRKDHPERQRRVQPWDSEDSLSSATAIGSSAWIRCE